MFLAFWSASCNSRRGSLTADANFNNCADFSAVCWRIVCKSGEGWNGTHRCMKCSSVHLKFYDTPHTTQLITGYHQVLEPGISRTHKSAPTATWPCFLEVTWLSHNPVLRACPRDMSSNLSLWITVSSHVIKVSLCRVGCKKYFAQYRAFDTIYITETLEFLKNILLYLMLMLEWLQQPFSH